MNDQISRQKLKPCPFCGGDKIRLTNWGLYRCWCANCLAQAADEISEKDAVEAWNRRVEPPADSGPDTNVGTNQWIPCSDPPKESGYYMACIYDSEVDNYDFRKTWFAHVDDYNMEESEWRELYDYETVTAWMPLPEPYKEGEKE